MQQLFKCEPYLPFPHFIKPFCSWFILMTRHLRFATTEQKIKTIRLRTDSCSHALPSISVAHARHGEAARDVYTTLDVSNYRQQSHHSPIQQVTTSSKKKYIYMTCNYVNFLQNKQHQQIDNTRNEQIGEIKWHFRATIRNKSPESLNEKKLNE